MSFNHELIAGLRQALEASPENLSLRKHLAEMLLHHGEATEAVAELKLLLRREDTPENQLLLANAYQHQQQFNVALAILESLKHVSGEIAARRDMLMVAHLIHTADLKAGQVLYQDTVKAYPELAREDLETQLFISVSGISASPEGTPPREPLPALDGPDLSNQKLIPPTELFNTEKPAIDFSQVGGMEQVKSDIQVKFIAPFQHPELYAAYGKKSGGGLLLYGPPGCGKTHLARATAGEVTAQFMSVGIHDILDMWLGQSEKNLHGLFEEARRKKPCVLFFDEVDALGSKRSDMRRSAGRQVINQFLVELDGQTHSNEGLFILAATNAPWQLDNAFRRPGRFDRIVFVPPPDAEGRAAIFKILLSNKPTRDIDYGALAQKTRHYSGADLAAVVDLTIEDKLQAAMKSGVPEPLRQKDLLKSLKQVRPSTQEWFTTAKNYALYANQGGLYDDILKYLDS